MSKPDYVYLTDDDTNACARCLHPWHNKECTYFHKERGRNCVCSKPIKKMKRMTALRLITCPLKLHPKRAMIPIEKNGLTIKYQCPRCKNIRIYENGELTYDTRNR